jgi:hypothetical protein
MLCKERLVISTLQKEKEQLEDAGEADDIGEIQETSWPVT